MVGKSRNTIRGTARSTTGIGPGGEATDNELGHGVTGTEQFGRGTAGEDLSDERMISGVERDFTGRGTPGGNMSELAQGPAGNLGASAGRVGQGGVPGGGASQSTARPPAQRQPKSKMEKKGKPGKSKNESARQYASPPGKKPSSAQRSRKLPRDLPIEMISQDPEPRDEPISTSAMTIEEAMQGIVSNDGQGGSGATGGDPTGERTPGGMSIDITQGFTQGAAGTYGGHTGGDLTGGGAGSGQPGLDESGIAKGGEIKSLDESEETGMAEKVIEENTKRRYLGQF